MTSLLVHWLIVAASILLTARIVPGIRISGWGGAFVAALILGALNLLLKPLLILLTLPLTVVTLGLFLLVVNAIVLLIAAKLAPGFRVTGFWAALLGAILISLFGTIADHLVGDYAEHHEGNKVEHVGLSTPSVRGDC
jgi:putative membrane protein